jgi:hypothetical protein
MTVFVVVALMATAVVVEAGQPRARERRTYDIPDNWSWEQVNTWLKSAKSVVELADTSIIIEVNSTDGDAGFQIFVDGDGWSSARVYDPNGFRILKVISTGGARHIGGGTELFMETAEPEYENLDGMQELIELLPEGEYFFVARTTDNDWAVGTAELTHDVPAGPEVVYPLPEGEEECAAVSAEAPLVIEWEHVENDIFGDGAIEIEAYQVIVESETEDGPDLEFSATLPPSEAATNMATVPPELLVAGTEYTFEILAIEESGNQTITEACFEIEE